MATARAQQETREHGTGRGLAGAGRWAGWIVGVALLCAGPGTAAWAISLPADFSLHMSVSQGDQLWTNDGSQLADELTLSSSGDETTLALADAKNVLGGAATIQSWSSTFDPDPFVTNNFVVVNNSNATQTFTFTVTSPVSPTSLVDEIIQSNVILSINDDDGTGGASVSSVSGSPVYQAFVNGSPELSLLDDPFANSCADAVDCALNGTSAEAVASQAFGPVSATSLGITIQFQLSPGDSAAVQSRFEIVPEPAAAGLVLLGAAGLLLARRRHAAH